MRRTLGLASVLVAAAALAAPASAAPTYADECTSGPAATASAEQPHVWDAGGDHGIQVRGLSPNGGAGDVRGGWVSARGRDRFAANIQLTELLTDPLNQAYRFEYPGALGTHYVSADYGVVDGWSFTYGHLEGVQQVSDGTTFGSVDLADAVVTIDLPRGDLPAKPTDGREVTFDVEGITAQFLVGATVGGNGGGVLAVTDTATEICTVVLYEEQPPQA